MTISSEISRNDRVGDGVLDTFIFEFEIYVKTDIKVWVDGVPKYVDIHFTVPVAGINNPAGGTIVFTGGNIPINLAKIAIILDLPLTQLTNYVEGDKFPAETHETALDRLVKIAQKFAEILGRIPTLLDSSLYKNLTLPDPVSGNILVWKSDLSGFVNAVYSASGTIPATNFDYGAAPPGAGTYALGFIRWNLTPVSGENIGWVCTVPGTPGIWKAFGLISL